MSAPDRLPDEALDGLLDGSPSQEASGTPLATYLAAIREDAQATTARPSEALQVLLAEGLDPADLATGGILTASTDRGSTFGILGWRLRGRTLGRVLATKFAALGLLGKAAAAGAAVTVAASGAGAAGVLPSEAQHAFDDAVGREAAQAPVVPDDTGDGQGAPDTEQEGSQTASTTPTTPADSSTRPPLETDVSDDATGDSDEEPGVDGGDIAEDASDGRSRADEKGSARPPSERAPADSEQGGKRVEDVPARDGAAADGPASGTPAEGTPQEAPGTSQREPEGSTSTPEQDAEQRPAVDRQETDGDHRN